jgi:hypothetical protein
MTQNIFRAFDFARARDEPLNKYVVLHLHETSTLSAATIFERIRHKYRDWLVYRAATLGRRTPPSYVFSFEAPGSPHVNWVLRVPPSLEREFMAKLPKWVAKVQGPLGPFDLDVSDVKSGAGDAYKALANYVAKGCDPAYLDHFHLVGLYDRCGPQGVFWGKRAGVSPALNKSARDSAGYDPKRRQLGVAKLRAAKSRKAA